MAFKFGVDSEGNYGYYKAGADSVTPFRTGNATVSDVLAGKTFANSTSHNLTGTMINNSSGYATIASNKMGWDSSNHFWCYIPENAYYSTAYWLQFKNSDVASKIGLTAEKIISGTTILGLTGTAKRYYYGQKGQYNPAGTHKFTINLSGEYFIAATHNGGSLYTNFFIQNGKILETREGTTKTDTYKFTASINGTTLSLTATGIPYYSYRWCGDNDLVDVPIKTLTGSQAVSFMGGGSNSITYNITFSSSFSTTPTVTLTPTWTSNGGWVDYIQAKSITKSGFTLYVKSLGGASSGKGIVGTVTWSATC